MRRSTGASATAFSAYTKRLDVASRPSGWRRQTAHLALVLLFGQFPRNAFRGTSRMYATDMLARQVVHTAIERGMIA